MALKDDILARKLAQPRRQPRPGPTISEDGSIHYRVFDEPISLKTDTPNEEGIASSPVTVLQTSETQVVLAAIEISNLNVSTASIQDTTKQEEGRSNHIQSDTNALVADFVTPDLLSTELMISGLALSLLKYLLTRIHDDVSGITAPIMFNSDGLSFASTASIKKTLQRLEKKGIIERVKFKSGPGGWTQYKICDHVRLKTFLTEPGRKFSETN